VAARSKAWVCGRAGIVGSNLALDMDIRLLCVLSEVSASGRSLVQRSPTQCDVSECDREASTVKRPGPVRSVAP
jgi:hypothetical protein